MKKLKGTLIGINVNKKRASNEYITRETVFKKGSRLNTFGYLDLGTKKIGFEMKASREQKK